MNANDKQLSPVVISCSEVMFVFLYNSLICFVIFVTGSNGHITYGGVTEEGFVINSLTGVITTTKELDREVQDHYTLTGNQSTGLIQPNMICYVERNSQLFVSVKTFS